MLYTQALISSAGGPAWTPELRERFFKLAIDRVPNWKGGYTVRPTRGGRMNAIVGMAQNSLAKKAIFDNPIHSIATLTRPIW